ncbi:RagB/SusD family nutrient uptake outer membrane protein [Flammeovirga sp. EKP202]|uniref:RagB/SusD family nutrient uptake outer membrane protein n=1 Tax=Flammeovirga sp. EKP202 TaxID=2770592 RepID=UPI00165F862F|nr:RagB/SusD family nutrient uptake outer membrane protein [Flammeovirga sp. EKP202]MBD0404162.1 RagB/SusD family nutrient uptake outer membrane protein [Flammeovirga sp. EKP202]
MKKTILKSVVALATVVSVGCSEQFLEVQPTDSITKEQVLSSPEGGSIAMNGIYRQMYDTKLTETGAYNHDKFGETAVHLYSDLRGEDLFPANSGYGWFNSDYNLQSRIASDRRPSFVWRYYYGLINSANEIISGIPEDASEDLLVYRGQALGIRAHAYFKLVQLFQFSYKGNEAKPGVVIYTEPSGGDSAPKGRATVQEVYDQILADLTLANSYLSGYNQSNNSEIDSKVINGFLARVYLVMNDWTKAAEHAAIARNGVSFADVTYGFDRSGRGNGWLWGMSVQSDQATGYASYFSHIDNTFFNYATLGQQKLINKKLYAHLADTDVRKGLILSPEELEEGNAYANYSLSTFAYMFFKYRATNPGSWDSDYVLMRAEEMLLIEAEAKAMLGQNSEASMLLQELVVTRDPSTSVSSLTGQALLNEISMQRRIELWGEGHRLTDLLRKNEALDRTEGGHNETLADVMTLPAGHKDWLLQIPQSEIDQNKEIVQND